MLDCKCLIDEFSSEHAVGEDVLDTQWLRRVGDKQWLAITRDMQILERETELRTLIESSARVVFLRPGDSLWWEMRDFLLANLDWLRRLYAEIEPPFVCIAHIAEPTEQATFVDLSL